MSFCIYPLYMYKTNIEVCLSTELLHLFDIRDFLVVIVDIFRATSTITAALGNGCLSIRPVKNIEEALLWRKQNYVLAGEKDGIKINGFDLGNSPVEVKNFDFNTRKMAFITTNGTFAINKSLLAKEILIGSFHNITVLANYLKTVAQKSLILCAGWKGNPCLEDCLFAGALVHELSDSFLIKQDAALICQEIFLNAKHDLVSFCKKSSHYARLYEMGIEQDLVECLRINFYPVLAGFNKETNEILPLNLKL